MIEQQAVAGRQASMLDIIKNRDFLKLWMAQLLSQTAQQIINFALVLQVHRISGSSTAVSGIIIAFTVPAILFAAIAGVFVERNSKKTMLVITNLARGVMVLAYLFTDERWGAGAVLPIFYVVTLVFSAVPLSSIRLQPTSSRVLPKGQARRRALHHRRRSGADARMLINVGVKRPLVTYAAAMRDARTQLRKASPAT
jgi:Na+/melibiose symporter-like transporter